MPDRLNDVAPERDRIVVPESSDTQAKARLSTSRHCARRVASEPRRRSKQDEPRRRLAQHVCAAPAGKSVVRGANPVKLPLEENLVGGSTCESFGRCQRCGHGDSTLVELRNAGATATTRHVASSVGRVLSRVPLASLTKSSRGNEACTRLRSCLHPGCLHPRSKVQRPSPGAFHLGEHDWRVRSETPAGWTMAEGSNDVVHPPISCP